MDSEKIACRTPASGRDGVTNIPRWKYDSVRRAILDALDDAEDGRLLFKDLAADVEQRLTTNQLAKLGSLGWHVTTVKLNMEVEGEIRRVPGRKPQTLQRLDAL